MTECRRCHGYGYDLTAPGTRTGFRVCDACHGAGRTIRRPTR